MKKYLTKANTLIAHRRYETGLILLTGVIGALSYFILGSNKIISSDTTPYFKQPEIISCSPNTFYDEAFDPSLEEVQINDNRKPAGELRNGIYYINLEVREGYWYPESKEGTPIRIKAFAQAGKPLQVPGPLIRVPEGTQIKARVRNGIKGPLVIFGFGRRLFRPEDTRDSTIIPEGETREISFNSGAPGTAFYTARDRADTVMPVLSPLPFFHSQLYGAMIIGAVNEKIDPKERIFMIGMCGTAQGNGTILTKFVINGMSWPHTELVSYRQGELVNWRVINTSVLGHPMHLHGFPFVIKNQTSGLLGKDSTVPPDKRREVVTQFLFPMNKMSISWMPAKEGNWLFHCHLLDHVLPASFEKTGHADHSGTDPKAHARNGMGGLVLGIQVQADKHSARKHPVKEVPQRRLTLLVGDKPDNHSYNANGKGFQLIGKGIPVSSSYSIPGPPIILTKNQPVAITVVNKLKEPTTIHWHGLEIDSYYDGVAGWGNQGKKFAPLIQPGDSFTVHITPPRAGTYMYHTHMHDRQLLDGLYGVLVVLEPGETYRPETDKIIMISQGASNSLFSQNWLSRFPNLHYLINGSNKPAPIELKKGVKYRLRIADLAAQENSFFVHINTSGLFISLKKNGNPVTWTLIDQDGMNIPARLYETKLANNQRNGPGTTRDYIFTPGETGDYLFEVKVDQMVEITQIFRVND